MGGNIPLKDIGAWIAEEEDRLLYLGYYPTATRSDSASDGQPTTDPSSQDDGGRPHDRRYATPSPRPRAIDPYPFLTRRSPDRLSSSAQTAQQPRDAPSRGQVIRRQQGGPSGVQAQSQQSEQRPQTRAYHRRHQQRPLQPRRHTTLSPRAGQPLQTRAVSASRETRPASAIAPPYQHRPTPFLDLDPAEAPRQAWPQSSPGHLQPGPAACGMTASQIHASADGPPADPGQMATHTGYPYEQGLQEASHRPGLRPPARPRPAPSDVDESLAEIIVPPNDPPWVSRGSLATTTTLAPGPARASRPNNTDVVSSTNATRRRSKREILASGSAYGCALCSARFDSEADRR
ncbi:hypothetical protein LTR53_003053 [Teratosphaeriaceae sp. CCFEE 6253]|nr:hypothetical protein LTR53_003053 [Teratosphaeriaceae sp. CCFEE 6253]